MTSPVRTAVVFDSAGTLLRTWRTAKNVLTGEVMPEVQTTTLTTESLDRVLTMLPVRPRDVMAEPAAILLSAYLTAQGFGYAISCANRPVSSEEVGAALFGDCRARVGDLQDCIRTVWACCRNEPAVALNAGVIVNLALPGIEYTIATGGVPFPGAIEAVRDLSALGDLQDCIRTVWACCRNEPAVALNAGVIVNLALPGIEYTIATGGVPFPGAIEAVRDLSALGADVYVASGDRVEKLLPMTRLLGIPDSRVHGTAPPSAKAAIVRGLRDRYDRVLMVGDGENDVAAMREADLGILSLQQPGERSQTVRDAAVRTITDLGEVVGIVRAAQADEPKAYKR